MYQVVSQQALVFRLIVKLIKFYFLCFDWVSSIIAGVRVKDILMQLYTSKLRFAQDSSNTPLSTLDTGTKPIRLLRTISRLNTPLTINQTFCSKSMSLTVASVSATLPNIQHQTVFQEMNFEEAAV